MMLAVVISLSVVPVEKNVVAPSIGTNGNSFAFFLRAMLFSWLARPFNGRAAVNAPEGAHSRQLWIGSPLPPYVTMRSHEERDDLVVDLARACGRCRWCPVNLPSLRSLPQRISHSKLQWRVNCGSGCLISGN